MSSLSPRLRGLLGVDRTADITHATLRDVVERRVREDEELDWKAQMHTATKKGRAELAADVAALANHLGGLLVIGVADDDSEASAVLPWDASDGDERRIRQTIAARVAPVPTLETHLVDCAEGDGRVLVIEVTQSTARPHGVNMGEGHGLRYPIRHGTTKRDLRENEIATAYEQRFTTRERRSAALVERMTVAGRAVGGSERYPWWVSFGFSPLSAGRYVINRDSRDAIVDELRSLPQLRRTMSSMAMRRCVVLDGLRASNTSSGTVRAWSRSLEVYSDGSSITSTGLYNATNEPEGTILRTRPAELHVAAITAVAAAAWHARRSGAGNEAVLSTRLFPTGSADLRLALAESDHRFAGPIEGVAPLPTEAVTLPATTFVLPDPNTRRVLGAARDLVTPVLQLLGMAESLLLDEEGRWVRSHWRDDLSPADLGLDPAGDDVI